MIVFNQLIEEPTHGDPLRSPCPIEEDAMEWFCPNDPNAMHELALGAG